MLHGTTAALTEVIRSRGLVEPWPGRRVSLTPDRRYAEEVARLACLRERAERAGRELEGSRCDRRGRYLDPRSPDVGPDRGRSW